MDRARFLEGWEAPFWGTFWGARFGVQTPSEVGYPRTFYEEFNDPVWIPFRGTLLGVLPGTKDPIFHGGFVACLHRSAFVSMSLH